MYIDVRAAILLEALRLRLLTPDKIKPQHELQSANESSSNSDNNQKNVLRLNDS